jgi:calcium-dependent protein kinase
VEEYKQQLKTNINNGSRSNSPERRSNTSSPRFKYNNVSNFELKLIDFGCSKIFSKKKKKFSDVIGTTYYAAPEVLNNNFDEKCDLWSCGVIMYILISGLPPFSGANEEIVSEKIKKGAFNFNAPEFRNVSQQAKDLIRWLLSYNPSDRPSAAKALHHEFFTKEIDTNNIYNEIIDGKAVLENLKNFKSQLKFNQAVVAYITHNFGDAEEKRKLTQLFKFIDKNSDGRISRDELIECYQNLGDMITNKEIDNILSAIDDDGSGFIEYEEFVRANLDKRKLMNETNLKMAFDLFDADNSGEISLEEIRNILGAKNLSDDVINDFLSQIGKSEADTISFEDFKKLMLNCITQ